MRDWNSWSVRISSDPRPAVRAVLGGAPKPEIALDELADRYFALTRTSLRSKAPDQVRKWRNPRIKAVNNLIAVIGNKSISEITRDDALMFRDWWITRVEDEGKDPGSANKDIGALNAMLTEVSDKLRLGIEQPFARMRLKGERHNPRTAFTPDFVRDRILKRGALDGLNLEARLVVYLMIETGMRPSEIVNLGRETICLDHDVPHAQIGPATRETKTRASNRDIPLVGVSLAAARTAIERFGGFPRYANRADNVSALINKVLATSGLRPTPKHSLYSLRHTFEDRLTALEPPERVQVELMGHEYSRPRYGSGPSLEQKRAWLLRSAFSLDVSPTAELDAYF